MTTLNTQIIDSESFAAQVIVESMISIAKSLADDGHSIQAGTTSYIDSPARPNEGVLTNEQTSAVKADTTLTINNVTISMKVVTSKIVSNKINNYQDTLVTISGIPDELLLRRSDNQLGELFSTKEVVIALNDEYDWNAYRSLLGALAEYSKHPERGGELCFGLLPGFRRSARASSFRLSHSKKQPIGFVP